MLTKNIFILLLFAFVIASCTKEDSLSTDDLIVGKLSSETLKSTVNKSENSSTVVVKERPGGPPNPFLVVDGASSKLRRNKNGITVNLKTNGLIPGNAYTLWWIVFDNPGTPPGPPTLNTAAVGHIVGASGKGNFSAHLSTGPNFSNPLTAEVHMVLRSHGPAVPGMIPDQIHTWDVGCDPELTAPTGPGNIWSDSDEIGSCTDVQIAVHPGS